MSKKQHGGLLANFSYAGADAGFMLTVPPLKIIML